jgi:pectinesterase inhibitor-like protein
MKIFTYTFLCLSVFLAFSTFIYPSQAATTELVKHICNQTSNYTFCVDSLYSDPRTPAAEAYVLAYVSFRLAYLNATATQDRIAVLLKHAASGQSQHLHRCNHDYKKATSALEQAYIDLDSETFFELADLAGAAAHAADDCQATFMGTDYTSLATMNKNLKGLSEICVVVSKLFTES